MSRLTIDGITSVRAGAEPLPLSAATYVRPDEFKSPHALSKPLSRGLDHHFSVESRGLTRSSLKKTASSAVASTVVPLGIGRPAAELYPWTAASLQWIDPRLNATDAEDGQPGACTVIKQGQTYNLGTALNYSHAAGSPQLVRFTTEHVELVHNPPYRDWSTCLTSGSTAALEVALRIFCNRGDTVLAEEYTYPGLTETAKIVGVRVCGVGMDAEGLKPDHLDRILSAWKRVAGPKPKMLYVIPSGQNPTGTSQSSERRRAIYDVAERHDLIIIEDDPYYFLHTGPFHDHEGSGEAGSVKAPEPYLHKLLPSYLSFDHSGRVVRLDSTSKILAPGLRAGWVTANTRVVEKFLSYQEFSTSVAGPTQLMLFTLLESSWGHRGFFTWLEHLSAAYRRRRDAVLRACEEFLPRDTCQWVTPEYGMFLWIRLDLERPHGCEPGSETHRLRLLGIENDILGKALENGVQVTKGSLFGTGDNDDTGIYFRLTFAAAAEEQLRGGVRRFAAAVSETLSLVATQSAPSVSVSTRQERVDRHAGVQGHIPVASG